jgi:hypothetical protein
MQIEAYAIDDCGPLAFCGESTGSPSPKRRPASFPDRYVVESGKRASILKCGEAPTIRVHLEAGFSLTASEARAFAPGSIFLDGAAQGSPFLLPDRGIYNLDHHEGCVRAFTLATCEQAMVLLRKRLDLRRREWTIYANGVDLDTVLAIWVLLNHLRLMHENPELAAEILPLIRLEGVIDALGVELQDLSALSPELMAKARSQMDELLTAERRYRSRTGSKRQDLGIYVAQQLRRIDRMVYPAELFSERRVAIDELARAEVSPGSIALACRSNLGVYEVEEELRRLHGDRLGLFALQTGDGCYTLRQVDPTLPKGLSPIYGQLNLVDPGSGGCAAPDRWGGSEDIGGSPRLAGSRMTPQQLVDACRGAQRAPRAWIQAGRLVQAVFLAALLIFAAFSPVLFPQAFEIALESFQLLPIRPETSSALLLLVIGGGLFVLFGRRAPGLYGNRNPTRRSLWILLAPVFVAVACGGLWIPISPFRLESAPSATESVLVLFALAVGVEVLFRGLVHGSLATAFRINRVGEPWRLSIPILVSSVLYASCIASHTGWAWPMLSGAWISPDFEAALPVVGGFLFGTVTGLARERSESVAEPVMLHLFALAACLAFAPL